MEPGALQKTELAIKSISKGKDKKEDNVLMMAPFANWDRFLTPAPSAIAILGELLIISTKADFTLTEKMPTGGFKYIKYPDSFRACLVQVSNCGWNAFNEAHTSMDQIRLMSANVDIHLRDSVRILMAGSSREIEEILPLSLRSIEQIADDSLLLAQNIEKQFLFVMHLTEELLEASTNTKSVYDQKAKNTATQMEVAELEKTRTEEAKKERQKRYENIEKMMNQAQDDYVKAINDMPGCGKLLGLSFAEGLVDSVKSLIGLPGDIIRGLGSASYNIAQDLIGRSKEQQNQTDCTSSKDINVRIAEHNVLSTVSMIDANIQSLSNIIGSPGHHPNLHSSQQELVRLQSSLSTHKSNVSAQKESGELGFRISNLCETASQICNSAQTIATSMSTSDTVIGNLQREVSEMRMKSMSLLAEANKKTGRNPLDEKSPCLEKIPVQSESLSIVKAAVETARFKTELAKETLRDTKDRQDAADNQLDEINERLCKTLKTMKTLEIEDIDFQTVRETLKQGISSLAQVKAQWGNLVLFFEEISNKIKCCMNSSLKKFVETTTVRIKLKEEGEIMSSAFRAIMYEQTLNASRLSYVVSTIAEAYVEISREHLMDQITDIADLIGLDCEKDSNDLIDKRQKLHANCHSAQSAIQQKIKEQHRKYENAIDARISRIEHDVEALMPPLDNLPAIQQAVKEGFTEDDLDDLVG